MAIARRCENACDVVIKKGCSATPIVATCREFKWAGSPLSAFSLSLAPTPPSHFDADLTIIDLCDVEDLQAVADEATAPPASALNTLVPLLVWGGAEAHTALPSSPSFSLPSVWGPFPRRQLWTLPYR